VRSASTTLIAVVLILSLLAIAAEAQQAAKIPKIGYLSPAAGRNPIDETFEQSLQALGWRRDHNVRFEQRWAGGRPDQVAPLAAELTGLHVDVIVAWSPAAALAAKRATNQTPVIFLAVGDPVAFGLVPNLARPGSNVTGVSFDAALESYGKGLEILKEANPSLRTVALLAASDPRTIAGKRTMAAAARVLGLELQEVDVAAPRDLETAVQKARDRGAQALYVWPSGLTFSFGKQIAELAVTNRLPSIHPFRESVVDGGLFSYGPSLAEIARRGAVYVDKILRGAKPADLPVEQPTTFELVVNIKTAKALGLTIPPSLLFRADSVIE
jgi:putative ABC transport system substrate-binding protein